MIFVDFFILTLLTWAFTVSFFSSSSYSGNSIIFVENKIFEFYVLFLSFYFKNEQYVQQQYIIFTYTRCTIDTRSVCEIPKKIHTNNTRKTQQKRSYNAFPEIFSFFFSFSFSQLSRSERLLKTIWRFAKCVSVKRF